MHLKMIPSERAERFTALLPLQFFCSYFFPKSHNCISFSTSTTILVGGFRFLRRPFGNAFRPARLGVWDAAKFNVSLSSPVSSPFQKRPPLISLFLTQMQKKGDFAILMFSPSLSRFSFVVFFFNIPGPALHRLHQSNVSLKDAISELTRLRNQNTRIHMFERSMKENSQLKEVWAPVSNAHQGMADVGPMSVKVIQNRLELTSRIIGLHWGSPQGFFFLFSLMSALVPKGQPMAGPGLNRVES